MAIRKVKNEIIDMIQEVAKRNHDRLMLPVLGTKYLRQVTDRATLQSRERMEQFVHGHELTSFDTLKEFKLTNEQKYNEMQINREMCLKEFSKNPCYIHMTLISHSSNTIRNNGNGKDLLERCMKESISMNWNLMIYTERNLGDERTALFFLISDTQSMT